MQSHRPDNTEHLFSYGTLQSDAVQQVTLASGLSAWICVDARAAGAAGQAGAD